MTLEGYLRLSGRLSSGGGVGRRVANPVRRDNNPSAFLNPNSIWDFSENRLYSLRELSQIFGVELERADEGSSGSSGSLAELRGEQVWKPGEVVFYSNFSVNYPGVH